MENYIWFTVLVVPIGFALCFFLDALTLLARLGGYLTKKNASGSYVTQVILVGSRFAVVLLFPAAAILVDTGFNSKSMFLTFSMGALLGSFLLLGLYLLREQIALLFVKRIEIFLKQNNQTHHDKKLVVSGDRESICLEGKGEKLAEGEYWRSNKRLNFVIVLVTFINGAGLSLPMILSASVDAYQLTVSHIGPLINVFATLINILYVEAILTRQLESTNSDSVWSLIKTFLLWRSLAMFLVSITYFLAYLYN
jgi:hypothetical protein